MNIIQTLIIIYLVNLNSFEDVVLFMEKYLNLEKKPELYSSKTYRLDRMKAMMACLGNPQNSYKIIHVAGSKGKGSTASFIASLLESSGYKTGLYMSPHVTDYRERFTNCGKFFSDKELIDCGNELKDKLDGFTYNGMNPTVFEMYTAFAFLLFKRTGCSWAVVETGLGGRLDATNIVTPAASILTPIELEHTELLGSTIELIAGEKSKIIKEGIPSFSALQKEEAQKVFENEAGEKHSKLVLLKDCLKQITTVQNLNGQQTVIEFTDGFKCTLNLKMQGLVQAQNCALAVLTARSLGFFNGEKSLKALENNTLPGRMERFEWKRTVFLDGAHTRQSIDNLIKTFREIYPGKRGICIFGSVRDKKHEEMAPIILNAFEKVVISKPGTFKKSDPDALFALFDSLKTNQSIVLIKEADNALQYCLEHTDKDEPILVCGSFYMAGEVKEVLKWK